MKTVLEFDLENATQALNYLTQKEGGRAYNKAGVSIVAKKGNGLGLPK